MTLFWKVCGLQSASDVQKSVAAGADALGCIFVPNTPRHLSIEAALPLAQAAEGLQRPLIGVFQNPSLATIEAHVAHLPALGVQLHGEESVAFAASVRGFLPAERPLVKVFSLATLPSLEAVMAYAPYCSHLLLDWPKGATSQPDWASAALRDWLCAYRQQGGGRPLLLLAGKLSPPTLPLLSGLPLDGVDVASGVEAASGGKDSALLEAFGRLLGAASGLDS